MKKLIGIIACIITFLPNALSQTWETLANIPAGLSFPVVVVLNGEIHVIGGGATSGATQLHLRYKPLSNVWDTLAEVPYKAQQPAGAVLAGKIHYFGGGYPNSGTPLSYHFVYDPTENKWTAAASLPIPRVIMKAATINGKLYAIGGQPNKTRVDEYNLDSNTWTLKNALPDNNFWYSALVVNNNEMYRFGGGGFTAPVNSVHKYNSTNDTWTNIATLPKSLHAPAGTALGGNIYIAGGYNFDPIDLVQIFNVNSLTFKTINPLPGARSYHELVTIDSCIYSVGGDNPSIIGVNVSLIRNCYPYNVSVNEIESKKLLNIFPNPAIDFISIESDENLTIEIYNLMGIKIMTKSIIDRSNRLDISGLPEGIYFYYAYSNYGKNTSSGKLLIAR